MFTAISIEADIKGQHAYQRSNVRITPPAGWCVVPEGMLPLENFPYGEIETTVIDEVTYLTKWTPLPIPEVIPLMPTAEELRKNAYETEEIINWPEGTDTMITVDQANLLYLDYFAEGNQDVCTKLQVLIANAKNDIRNRYPD